MIEPQQGATYADQLALAKAVEELGFSALFRSDHFLVKHVVAQPMLSLGRRTYHGAFRHVIFRFR